MISLCGFYWKVKKRFLEEVGTATKTSEAGAGSFQSTRKCFNTCGISSDLILGLAGCPRMWPGPVPASTGRQLHVLLLNC